MNQSASTVKYGGRLTTIHVSRPEQTRERPALPDA
jgi:hypothetical protein